MKYLKLKLTKGFWFRLFIGLTICIAGFAACTQLKGDEPPRTQQMDNHRKMLAILKEVDLKIQRPENTYAGEARLAYYDSLLNVTNDPQKSVNLAVKVASVLLEIGQENRAVAMYEQIYEFVKTVPSSRLQIGQELGLAYLRLAERTNCVMGHNSDACIMPIKGRGIHVDKEPARKAVEMFESVLNEDPSVLDSRWLLNIAYMTLGEYPEKVPGKFLIPGLADEGSIKVKPFTEMASDLGIDVRMRAGGSIVEDFNNDGYLDIVTSGWGLDDPMHYFRNNADGTFADVSAESGLAAITGGLNLLQTDYDNDGFMDIFVLRGGWQGTAGCGEQPNSLLRNNGDGTFTDVTIEAGLLTYHPTQTATWNDFNNDGWLDLFIGNETSSVDQRFPCEFYINNKNGTFTNVVTPEKFNIALFVKGVTSGDFDNDGWADIFLSCLSGEKLLLRNQGVSNKVPEFTIVSENAGFTESDAGTFPTFFFDYDNDGWLDIFMCKYVFDRPLSFYAAQKALEPASSTAGNILIYRNNGNGTFTNVSSKMHIDQAVFAMGANFGDFDNDGWLDMYMSTGNPSYKSLIPNRLYKNMNGRDFIEVTNSARVGHLQKGHGVSFADLNNNGDQDLYVNMGGAFRGDAYNNSFYLNPGQNNNNWICMKLVGSKSNKAAIGAKVQVKFRENGVERSIYREVNSGGSFGCSPLRREIGIGQATLIDEIKVTWPASGIVQTFKNVKPNQFIKVTEGVDDFQIITLKTLKFKKLDGTIPMCAPVALQ